MSTSAERTQEYKAMIESLKASRIEILAKIDEYANAEAGSVEEADALQALKEEVKGQADIVPDPSTPQP